MAQNILSPVRVATNEHITLAATGSKTIDGILLAQDDRVLVKSQTSAVENGIYVVQSDGSLSRATDFAAAATQSTLSSAIVFVESGAIFAETGWILEPDTFAVGTSAITFKRFTINENLESLVDDVLSYIVLRREKGSPLTNDELDNNFLYLSTSIEDRVRKVDYTASDVIAKIKSVSTETALIDVYSVRGKTLDDTSGTRVLVTKDSSGTVNATTFAGNLNGNATTATNASTANLAGNVTGVVAITNGGTGRTSAAEARTALQVVHNQGDTITGKLVLAKPSGDDIALLNVGSTEPLSSVSGDVWLNASGQMRYNRAGSIYTLATLTSPSFTGTPSAPTPASNNNSDRLATTAFVQTLKVGLESQIALKADAATSYTKTQTDGFLALKANSADVYVKADVYTKTQTDGFLALKANSADVYVKADVYTKTEADNLFGAKANLTDLNNYATLTIANQLSLAIGTKANSTDVYTKVQVYTKTETDNLLALKANSADVYVKAEVYTKTESNNLLNLKANSADVYTKTETDNLLALKANSADVYVKAEVYTKTESNNLLNLKANSNSVYTISQSDATFATISYVNGLQDKWGTSKKFVQTVEPTTGVNNGDFWFKI